MTTASTTTTATAKTAATVDAGKRLLLAVPLLETLGISVADGVAIFFDRVFV